MMQVGRFNKLNFSRSTRHGIYLQDEEGKEVLLPNSEVPEDFSEEDPIEVFIYTDSEDRLIATTLQPKAIRDEFAYMQVVEVSAVGAFLDWGLRGKDLLVPFSEQRRKMQKDNWYLVFVYLDELTNRLVASSKINRFFEHQHLDVQTGDEVELLVGKETDLGFNVVVNNKYRGLIYHNEIFRPVRSGFRIRGFVHQIREDGKLDIRLSAPGFAKVEPNAQKILTYLENQGGFLDLTDKSDPESIKRKLAMSKKTFKKAVGVLYKQRLIRLEPGGIFLNK
ncbi:CvfB family protein [Flavilitoribacter nigricans]|uniref:GntR family transcriptional regulator n=1 Tax=Flavilitoribacter nigricans (strain ATCC 23147 / DSM 23189 / NBRC 102662 / NCIMB 1420 / SS-2) TaxID=1122177 RepID=A0A2D0N6E0_FLAN2|nr:S1-like domain-containing RNA-binding protein [Flavilitoribacter nigricans]PHN03946.1 GntR family transcriptional regulator [Flavilitoribacter nigricans DSM 23189 = NBRC 102662]